MWTPPIEMVVGPTGAMPSQDGLHPRRLGVVLVGIFLLLAALGQLSGIDILGETVKILGTEVGRWLLVAVVAIALIAVAVHGFRGGAD